MNKLPSKQRGIGVLVPLMVIAVFSGLVGLLTNGRYDEYQPVDCSKVSCLSDNP